MPSMELLSNMNGDHESQSQMPSSDQKRGGWFTFFFVSATLTGLAMAGWGWLTNLVVYLIEEFNVKSIDATQVANVVNGSISMIAIVGALLADSFLGSFRVISISSFLSLLGTLMLTLTATISHLRPQHCETGSTLCHAPSKLQLAVLYTAICLASIGMGVVRSVLTTLGANQFDNPKDQATFFNWFIFTVRKRNVLVSSENKDYYQEISDASNKSIAATPKGSFRFLNHAAIKTEGDINSDGSIAKPWRICSVQQVEDLKTLIRIFPLWASSVFLATPIAIQANMSVLQALSMDRHLGSNFKIPAGSITILVFISCATFIALLDRFLFPTWQTLTGRPLTPLERIGTGHAFNILSTIISALVESKRLKTAHDNQQGAVPMLALWLFPQLILVGVGEAFHLPGNVLFYYQEFPASMKSTATSMMSIVIGIAFYFSTALVDLIRNVTGWLPADINHGRLDNVYWTFVVLGLLNFGYFLLCAKFYKYNILDKEVETNSRL
ncbi:hypothetical protein V6N11_002596 [Hibiscus sabdariffa]|uniref:Uncharacterized protein n=1 Tax=Hibiscus sabdariffa TaxID=183260 RepID=A0ABR2SAS2_9ROSI